MSMMPATMGARSALRPMRRRFSQSVRKLVTHPEMSRSSNVVANASVAADKRGNIDLNLSE